MFWYKCAEVQFIVEFETLVVLGTVVRVSIEFEANQLDLHHMW